MSWFAKHQPGSTQGEFGSRIYLKVRLALEGLLIGVIVGLVIVVFRHVVEAIQQLVRPWFTWGSETSLRAFVLLLVFGLIGILGGLLSQWEPMIAGSGIPQVAGKISGQLELKWYRVLPAKIFGGFLTLGSGLTMGREGPSVQIGASVGEAVSQILHRPETEHKYLISTGAASGLAAAFSAPISGIVFALEEVHRNFSALALISAMTGAITADFITKTIFGLEPELAITLTTRMPLREYWILILLGLFVGLGSWLFNTLILRVKSIYQKLPIPLWCKTIIPFICTAAVILLGGLDFFGAGQEIIHWAATPEHALPWILLIGGIKLVLLLLAFCSGLPGGIFFPLLVLGSLVGHGFGLIFAGLGVIEPDQILVLAVLAMAGNFAGIVRAPVTGILLICEMTGSFASLLPLALVSVVAYLTAEAVHCEPIYESLLHFLVKDRKAPVLHHLASETKVSGRVLLEYAVHHETQADGALIRELPWPENILIVAVKRGGREVLPRGYIRLKGGDYLVVLIPKSAVGEVDPLLRMICSEECLEHVTE